MDEADGRLRAQSLRPNRPGPTLIRVGECGASGPHPIDVTRRTQNLKQALGPRELLGGALAIARAGTGQQNCGVLFTQPGLEPMHRKLLRRRQRFFIVSERVVELVAPVVELARGPVQEERGQELWFVASGSTRLGQVPFGSFELAAATAQ